VFLAAGLFLAAGRPNPAAFEIPSFRIVKSRPCAGFFRLEHHLPYVEHHLAHHLAPKKGCSNPPPKAPSGAPEIESTKAFQTASCLAPREGTRTMTLAMLARCSEH
jgi:hypothetical protein